MPRIFNLSEPICFCCSTLISMTTTTIVKTEALQTLCGPRPQPLRTDGIEKTSVARALDKRDSRMLLLDSLLRVRNASR